MPEHAKNEPTWTLQSLNLDGNMRLEACPFCGTLDVHLYEYTYSKLFTVDCQRCGAQGPRRLFPFEAQEEWNRRAVGNGVRSASEETRNDLP